MTEEIQRKGVGYRLQQAREHQGLMYESVASQLNLSIQTVIALEADDVDKLPPPSFTRGYLRAYAKLLGIDDDDLVSHYNESAPANPQLLLSSQTIEEPHRKAPLVLRVVSFIVIAACILLSLGWYGFYYMQSGIGFSLLSETIQSELLNEDNQAFPIPAVETGEIKIEPKRIESESAVPLVMQVGNNLGRDTPNTDLVGPIELMTEGTTASSGSSLLLSDVLATESQRLFAEAFDSSSVLSVSDISITVPPPEVLLSTDGNKNKKEIDQTEPKTNDILEIATDSSSWVEVVDANGVQLIYDMLQSEEARQLQGTAPFLVFLGNTPSISIAMNGNAVQKPKYSTSRNTSRFIVYADGSLTP